MYLYKAIPVEWNKSQTDDGWYFYAQSLEQALWWSWHIFKSESSIIWQYSASCDVLSRYSFESDPPPRYGERYGNNDVGKWNLDEVPLCDIPKLPPTGQLMISEEESRKLGTPEKYALYDKDKRVMLRNDIEDAILTARRELSSIIHSLGKIPNENIAWMRNYYSVNNYLAMTVEDGIFVREDFEKFKKTLNKCPYGFIQSFDEVERIILDSIELMEGCLDDMLVYVSDEDGNIDEAKIYEEDYISLRDKLSDYAEAALLYVYNWSHSVNFITGELLR